MKNRRLTKSAVCEHALDKPNHYMHFDKRQVLAKENRYIPRMLREAIEIKKHPNFNREDGWQWQLPPAWDLVINLIKSQAQRKTVRTLDTDVWNKLQELPFGFQQTYGDLAKSLGRAASHSRAVGAACGANTHLIVIPCHRLVASGSGKGGFSAGLNRKDMLLAHEKKYST